MTINASTACGGTAVPLSPSEPASAGAGADASAFSETLSGMAELPETAEAPLATIDELEDLALPDLAAATTDATAEACVAALIAGIATPAPVTQLKQTALSAKTVAAAVTAAGAATGAAPGTAASASENDALAVWLAMTSKGSPGDGPTPEALIRAELLDQQASPAAQSNGGTAGTSAAAPAPTAMTQVSQLGSALAQTTSVVQPQPSLHHNVGTARWAEELGSRLTLMAGQGKLSGSLTLTPEHLGPLHVQIDIKNDVANVWFGSQHADTRAALHDALPRLREMFGTAGLVLGDTGVSRDTPRQEAQAAEVRRFAAQREEAVTGTELRSIRIAHAGILDTYA